MASGRRHSRHSSVTSKDLSRIFARNFKAVSEMANNLNLGVDEGDMEELLEGFLRK